MATQVQIRRGTTAQHASFTGAAGELTVDTDKKAVVVHDGSTAGGIVMLRADQSNLPTSAPTTGLYTSSGSAVISTGGSGRLFVDANGNVGFNKTPANSANYTTLDIGGTNGGQLLLGRPGFLDAFFYSSNGLAALGAGSGSALALFTNSSGISNERVRITSAGLVGIGTSTPSAPLQVDRATAGVGVQITNTTTYSQLRLTSNGTNQSSYLTFNPTGTGKAIIQVADTDRVAIDSAGNVGIGTTGPQDALSVYPGTTGGISLLDSGNTARSRFFIDNSGGVYSTGIRTDNYFIDFDASGSSQNAIRFRTGTGSLGTGTERARIDSSGRLLVGTSSSLSNAVEGGVQIVGTAADAYLTLTRFNASASAPAGIVLGRSKSGTKGTNTAVADGDFLGIVEFTGADGGTSYRSAAHIAAYVDGAVSGGGAADMPGRLVFSTCPDGSASPSPRMTIRNNGEVLIGAAALVTEGTNDTFGFGLSSAQELRIAVNNAKAAMFKRGTSDGTVIDFRKDTALVGTISVTASATAYNTSSDYRLKENVTAVTDGITRLQQLKPSRFNFIADPSKTVDGFLAHEAAEVVPECVTGEKDAVDDEGNPIYQGIDQSKLVPLLTAALQEAITKIESLEARIAALVNA